MAIASSPRVGAASGSRIRFGGDQVKVAALYEGTDALMSDDIADAVVWAATRPVRVNIDAIEMMPGTQAFGPLAVHKEEKA